MKVNLVEIWGWNVVIWGQKQKDGMMILLFGLNQKVSFVIMDQMKTISLELEEALTVFLLYVAREPKI